jgi:peptidoglycan/xylan/chitin deacetylase (PgdA/CDA1 family)
MRSLLKNAYYQGLAIVSADRRAAARLARTGMVPVLNLHRISPHPNSFWPPLQPKIFEELLIFLKENFEVRRFAELSLPANGRPVVVLSFDDGYYDFVEYALPLLSKHKVRANLNLIPQCAETGTPIWNVRLYDFLEAAPRGMIDRVSLPGFAEKLSGDDPRSRLAFGIAISRHLKNRSRAEREQLWQPIEELIAKVDCNPTRMMTTEELLAVAGETELGVHSYSHESMAYESQAFFEDDVRRCRDYFADKLRMPMKIYAFPNGSYRQEQVEFLRREGIERVLLVDEKIADRNCDVVPRITMYGESATEIRMRAVGF